MDRNSAYVRTIIYLHGLRDKTRDTITKFHEQDLSQTLKNTWDQTRRTVMEGTKSVFKSQDDAQTQIPEKYDYIFRRKTRLELVRLSGTVCGIEFCYAAETAFVTPTLLGLGLNIKFVSMIWCLSPVIGFFLTPLLGSLSDSCESRLGRRRPFILLLSAGILLGLILVPNGRAIGVALGDSKYHENDFMLDKQASNRTFGQTPETFGTRTAEDFLYKDAPTFKEGSTVIKKRSVSVSYSPSIENSSDSNPFRETYNVTIGSSARVNTTTTVATHELGNDKTMDSDVESTTSSEDIEARSVGIHHLQVWSVVFTVLGTVLLDFCSDACQSPSRTYLLDSSIPDDHAVGLSTFTLMAGFGGSVGYLMGAVHWDNTFVGSALGGQIHAVFSIVAVIFVLCLISTISSFPEIPLSLLKNPQLYWEFQEKIKSGGKGETSHEMVVIATDHTQQYGSNLENGQMKMACLENNETNQVSNNGVRSDSILSIDQLKEAIPHDMKPVPVTEAAMPGETLEQPTIKEYLRSIIRMPGSLAILCLTNLFCWMSLVCYSLYFTDFVGECVFEGNAQAPEDSVQYQLYQDGVSFGCWGMALYSISCSVYSYFIEVLVKKLGAKPVYIGGQLIHSFGMVGMAAFRHPVAVILLSPTAGVMYSTLFTMPYLLIAHYHSTHKFNAEASGGGATGVRGIGTDVAVVSSMVFLSQFILSLSMGTIVEAVGSKVATVGASALLSACGALCATQVLYLEE